MPSRPLTAERKADAKRLRERYDAWLAKYGAGRRQPEIAALARMKPSIFSQRINGTVALNKESAAAFAKLLGCAVEDFSPSLAAEIAALVQPHQPQRLGTVQSKTNSVSDMPVAGSALALDNGGGAVRHRPRVRQRSDLVQIPQLAVGGSMGTGAYPPDHIDVIQYVTARVSDLRKQCTFSDPAKLQIITGYGNSMEPTFRDGDPLLIDTAINTVDIEAIYVFTFKGELFIKSLQRVPGSGLLAISHNELAAKPWPIKVKDIAPYLIVHGRVILAWNARRF